MHNLKFVFWSVVLLTVGAFAQSLPTATLTASDAATNGGFLGSSVVISGSTIAAGAPAAEVSSQTSGVVYVFTKTATAPWTDMTEAARLVAPALGLGSAIAMSGDASVIVAGTHGVGSAGASDMLFVFLRPAAGWKGTITPNATLTLDPPQAPWIDQGQFNGVAMNASGTTIVAGTPNAGYKAHFHDGQSVPAVPNLGAAYVWVEPAQGWASADGMSETATLSPSEGVANDSFGNAVAVAANTIVVGASTALTNVGKVYLFQRPATGWPKRASKFTAKFTASDGQIGDNLGWFVAVGDSGALVAAGTVRGCPSSSGPTYVFAKPSTGWPSTMEQTAELTSSDGGICFGEGPAIGQNLIIVGAPATGGRAQPGASYSFAKPTDGWTDMSLPASMIGGSGSVHFGTSNSVWGRTIVVGAPQTTVSGNSGAGAVYVFGQ